MWAKEQDWFGLKKSLDFTKYLETKDKLEAKYKFDELTGEILWETKTLDLIPISQMTTQHIQNAMRMCIKNNWRTEYVQVFQIELDKRTLENLKK